jgi:cysteine desulfurase
MILHSAVKDLGVKTIISSSIEHHAILHAMDALKLLHGIEVLFVNLLDDGSIDLKNLASLLQKDTSKKLVSLMHVNNEIGNILDLTKVGELCHVNNALFHTDAVQGIGHYTFDMDQLPVDFLSAAAHKFHGPKGVGFSFVRKNSGLQPSIHGGSQERGLRAGTESVHNIVGMCKALELAYANLNSEKKQVLDLKRYFIEKISILFPNVVFNGLSGSDNGSTFTLVNVALPISKEKSSLLDFHLDLKGIACSKGSACQSGSSSGSHVLNAVQQSTIKDWPSLRFSFSIFNSKKEVDYLMEVLKDFSA